MANLFDSTARTSKDQADFRLCFLRFPCTEYPRLGLLRSMNQHETCTVMLGLEGTLPEMTAGWSSN